MNVPQYSEYQFFFYQTITANKEKGKNFDQITKWLNQKEYLSVRGQKLKSSQFHSLIKKKRLKDEKLEIETPEVDFSLGVVNKALVNRL